MSIDDPVLFGALVGAGAAILGGVLGGWLQGWSWYHFEKKRAADEKREQWRQKVLEWAARGRKDNFRHADLRGANLVNVDLGPGEGKDEGADLSHADLRGAILGAAYLRGAILWGANLEGANLWGANLMEANLMEANLMEANQEGADLREDNLEGADLWRANLKGATVKLEQLEAAEDLTDAIMPDGSKWKGSEAGGED